MKINHLSPFRCPICEKYACYDELPFCSDCINEIQKMMVAVCRKCGRTAARCECAASEGLRFAFFYKGRTVQHIIYMHKMHTDKRIEDFLAELAVRASGINIKGYDAITFVPRVKRNRKRFGYDQSELFAKSISKMYGIKLIYPLLRIGGREQKYLSRSERYKNMKNRFVIRSDYDTEVKYKKLLLVDDVTTTGATIQACADILRGAVARAVIPLVIARTD